ncbi:MAG: arginosuccinate synthase [Leptospiraceae bacterium]|nr:arginosuccinate synthase [Leptospiraceae bacterium]MCP5512291.1 arginosuccinate synthase [Leptospiraceae bacterium]
MKIHEQIFSKIWSKISDKKIFQNPLLLSYSGGKDSTALLGFCKYLKDNRLCGNLSVFHMDHSIRDTTQEVREIKEFLNSLSLDFTIKKKTFPLSQNV